MPHFGFQTWFGPLGQVVYDRIHCGLACVEIDVDMYARAPKTLGTSITAPMSSVFFVRVLLHGQRLLPDIAPDEIASRQTLHGDFIRCSINLDATHYIGHHACYAGSGGVPDCMRFTDWICTHVQPVFAGGIQLQCTTWDHAERCFHSGIDPWRFISLNQALTPTNLVILQRPILTNRVSEIFVTNTSALAIRDGPHPIRTSRKPLMSPMGSEEDKLLSEMRRRHACFNLDDHEHRSTKSARSGARSRSLTRRV